MIDILLFTMIIINSFFIYKNFNREPKIVKELRKDIYMTAKSPMAAKKAFIKSDKYET